MENLQEIFANKLFISDLGEDQKAIKDGKEVDLGRYAVWSPIKGSDHFQVIEVGSDLELLMKKYNLTEESVCRLNV